MGKRGACLKTQCHVNDTEVKACANLLDDGYDFHPERWRFSSTGISIRREKPGLVLSDAVCVSGVSSVCRVARAGSAQRDWFALRRLDAR